MNHHPFVVQTFASIFCGCGGLDSGFISAGLRPTKAWDSDPDAVRTYRDNYGDVAQCVDASTASDLSALGTPDLLLAGPPCQGFSTIGKRDFHDPRNSLLELVGDYAERLKPKAVVVENVPGALAGEHRDYWLRLSDRLRQQGFDVSSTVCAATSFGLPQRRKRLILIAVRSGSGRAFEIEPVIETETSLQKTLAGVERFPDHEPTWLARGSDDWKIASRIKPGQKLCNVRGGDRAVHTWDLPEVFGSTSTREKQILEGIMKVRRRMRRRSWGDADPAKVGDLKAAIPKLRLAELRSLIEQGYVREIDSGFDLTHTFNGKFRRLSWDGLSPTVDTRFGQPRYFLHPAKNRGLSVREARRIQGFDDSFSLPDAKTVAYRLLGNAVPPPISTHIAKSIVNSFRI